MASSSDWPEAAGSASASACCWPNAGRSAAGSWNVPAGTFFVYQPGVRVCDLRTLIQRFSRRFERLRQRNLPPSSEASLRRRPLEVLPDQELERAEVAVGEGLEPAPAGRAGGPGSARARDPPGPRVVVLPPLRPPPPRRDGGACALH